MNNRRLPALILLCLLSAPAGAAAQDVPLSQLLVNLIQADILLAPPPVGVSHAAHFVPGADQQLAPYYMNQQLIVQLGTFPLGSSSGGFSYTFDDATATFQRSSQSFGPAFAERALTLGRKKFSAGMTYQYSSYSSFEGKDLGNGDVKFYLRHQPTGTPPFFFEGDVIEAALNLDVSSQTTTFFANYGLLNNWDVAVAVPIQHVSMDAVVDASVMRLATGSTSTIHQFVGGGTTSTFSDSGSATGIGDVLLRSKYRFLSMEGGGLAVGGELRLPTGDEQNLLGTGSTQGTVWFIGSSTHGRWSPHFNFGYTGSSESDVAEIPNEWGYRGGTEFLVSNKVTISADYVGRTLVNAGRLVFQDTTLNFMSAGGVAGSTTVNEPVAQDGNLNLSSLAVGGKINVGGTVLVNVNVLFNLGSAGVNAPVTPVVGVDWSF